MQQLLYENKKVDGGVNLINNRSLTNPHAKFKKTLGRLNNFSSVEQSKMTLTASKLGDLEVFDPEAA